MAKIIGEAKWDAGGAKWDKGGEKMGHLGPGGGGGGVGSINFCYIFNICYRAIVLI